MNLEASCCVLLNHGRYFKKGNGVMKHIVGGGGGEKVEDEGQQVLLGYLETAKAREEKTGGKPQEDKYAIVWLVCNHKAFLQWL